MSQPDERMVTRLQPATRSMHDPMIQETATRSPGFLIEIPADDGTMLVRLREVRGRLVVEGDESRWDEGAKRFLYQMMQWSGQVGLRWKDEAKAAVQ